MRDQFWVMVDALQPPPTLKGVCAAIIEVAERSGSEAYADEREALLRVSTGTTGIRPLARSVSVLVDGARWRSPSCVSALSDDLAGTLAAFPPSVILSRAAAAALNVVPSSDVPACIALLNLSAQAPSGLALWKAREICEKNPLLAEQIDPSLRSWWQEGVALDEAASAYPEVAPRTASRATATEHGVTWDSVEIRRQPRTAFLDIPGGSVLRFDDVEASGFAVLDAAGEWIPRLSIGPRPEAATAERIPGVGVLVGDRFLSFNMAHLLLDKLPRLRAVREIPGARPVFFEDSPLVRDLCVLAGLSEPIIVPPGGAVAFDRLVVAGSAVRMAHPFAGYHPDAMDFARSVLERVPETWPGPLFISRADASKRRAVNEEELISLMPRGTRVVKMSGLPLSEQVAQVKGASAVVGVHGAGLALPSIFGRPLAECAPEGSAGTDGFFIASSQHGRPSDYCVVRADAGVPPQGEGRSISDRGDFSVHPEAFARALEVIGHG